MFNSSINVAHPRLICENSHRITQSLIGIFLRGTDDANNLHQSKIVAVRFRILLGSLNFRYARPFDYFSDDWSFESEIRCSGAHLSIIFPGRSRLVCGRGRRIMIPMLTLTKTSFFGTQKTTRMTLKTQIDIFFTKTIIKGDSSPPSFVSLSFV